MNNLIVVNIRVFNLNSFLMNSIKNNIYIERISYQENILKCKIKREDLIKINKYYKVTIVKSFSFASIIFKIKQNYLTILSIIISMFLFLFFKNIIYYFYALYIEFPSLKVSNTFMFLISSTSTFNGFLSSITKSANLFSFIVPFISSSKY